MHFPVSPFCRFPGQCFIKGYGLGYRWVAGLVLLVVMMGGCAKLTIPSCKGTPFNTPCAGPCTVEAEPGMPSYTQVLIPLAVVIHDRYGNLHCQDIKP